MLLLGLLVSLLRLLVCSLTTARRCLSRGWRRRGLLLWGSTGGLRDGHRGLHRCVLLRLSLVVLCVLTMLRVRRMMNRSMLCVLLMCLMLLLMLLVLGMMLLLLMRSMWLMLCGRVGLAIIGKVRTTLHIVLLLLVRVGGTIKCHGQSLSQDVRRSYCIQRAR